MPAIIALILLGIIQGLTEFLPVSSSGHLSLFQYFSKDINENLSLNIAVHVGTLFTVLFFYRRDLQEMLNGIFRRDKESMTMVALIVVATIPTGIIGILMKKEISWALTDPVVAASCLIVTGLVLFFSDRIEIKNNFQTGFGTNWSRAFLIGIVQGLAVLPGISRSGTTIVAGLFLGMSPKNASRFSFLMSIPAIAGAGLLEAVDLKGQLEWTPLLVGGFVSFFVGLIAISLMVKITMLGRLKVFSYYVFALSFIFFVCYFAGWGKGIL